MWRSRGLSRGDNERFWRTFGKFTRLLEEDNKRLWRTFVEASLPLSRGNCCGQFFLWKPRGLLRETTIERNLLWKPRSLPRDTTKNSGNPFEGFRRRQPTVVENLCRSHEASRGRQRTVVEIICGNLEASRGRRLLLGTFVEAPRPLEGDSERL